MTAGVKEKYDKLIIHDERGITPIRRWGKPEDIGRAVRAIADHLPAEAAEALLGAAGVSFEQAVVTGDPAHAVLELIEEYACDMVVVGSHGMGLLRSALQGYLRRARGLACAAEQIVVVHGSQQAIDLCARVLLNAGDAFVFEDPGYLMARRCFEATGARCLPTPVDALGLETQALSGRA